MSTRTQYAADLAALKGSLAKMSQLTADAEEDALEALSSRWLEICALSLLP
mgnify:CR=1 FL=1